MKNYLSVIIFTILTVNLVAQDITVSFKPSDTGAVIDSFQAINLATNDTVRLKGNETLTLINLTSGISSVQNRKGSIFPNPSNGSATLQFSTSAGEDATIQVVNASGQLVMEKKQAITAGAHSFSVGFPGPGIYVVLVRAGNQVLSFKEVSNMSWIQEPSLSYLGSSQRTLELATLKSVTTGKTLNYSTGNNIMYTLYSGKNSRVMVEQPSKSQTIDVAFYACADKDGKNYKTVTIGNQVWMAENLAYLPYITSPKTYSCTEPYYYVYDYEGTSVSEAKATTDYVIYGVMYNWTAALYACPLGWHLPSDAEWTVLSDYLGGEEIAGGKMKSTTGWNSSNTGATNESCFSALPGGYLLQTLDDFYFHSGLKGDWWSSTANGDNYAWGRYLYYNQLYLRRDYSYPGYGFSVRCVRD